MRETIGQRLYRVRREAELATTTEVAGHEVSAYRDHAKAFRSQPGSADHRACCTCGWVSSVTYYGKTEALAGAWRHLRKHLNAR